MPANNPTWEATEGLDKAFNLARELHKGQSRKTEKKVGESAAPPGAPYIGHLLIVAGSVIDHGGTETQAMAALMHDAVEDTSLTVEQVERALGSEVAAIVDACTDADDPAEKEADKTLPTAEREAKWWERKERYLKRLAAKSADDPSVLVALADKVHNSETTVSDLRQLDDAGRVQFWSKFNVCRWYQNRWYDELLSAFREGKTYSAQVQPLVQRLAIAVEEIKRLSPPPTEHDPH